jgi:transposase InsO family protein
VVYGGDARGHRDARHPRDRQYRSEITHDLKGCQFTSEAFTALLKEHGIAISMDSKGRAIDNIFIERFWRSLKYEYVYLQPADDGVALCGTLWRSPRLHRLLQPRTITSITRISHTAFALSESSMSSSKCHLSYALKWS